MLQTRYFNLGFNFHFKWKRGETVSGFSNRTSDGKYLVFLDYDRQKPEQVLMEVEDLIEQHQLGNSILVKSSNEGHHFLCFDKLTRQEFYDVLRSSNADKSFKLVPIRAKHYTWILRTTMKAEKKPKIIRTFISQYNCLRKKSLAHIQYANKFYKADWKDTNNDGLTKLVRGTYEI